MKLLRYIKSIIHYYKTRRALKRGARLYESTKAPSDIIIDEELKVIDEIVLRNTNKYNVPLHWVVDAGWIGDDFEKGLKTLKIEMWYEIKESSPN